MDWLEILQQLFNLVIIPLLGIGTIYVIGLIKTKKQAILEQVDSDIAAKYIGLLEQTIIDCVIATNQTYVNSLKEQGKFDAEAQKVAFEKTYTAVMAILTEDAKVYLGYALGDLEVYVTNKIEATVTQVK